jgi:hypothetical protein
MRGEMNDDQAGVIAMEGDQPHGLLLHGAPTPAPRRMLW